VRGGGGVGARVCGGGEAGGGWVLWGVGGGGGGGGLLQPPTFPKYSKSPHPTPPQKPLGGVGWGVAGWAGLGCVCKNHFCFFFCFWFFFPQPPGVVGWCGVIFWLFRHVLPPPNDSVCANRGPFSLKTLGCPSRMGEVISLILNGWFSVFFFCLLEACLPPVPSPGFGSPPFSPTWDVFPRSDSAVLTPPSL